MSHALILANGAPPDRGTLRRCLAPASLFVCADGGANVARELKLTPDAIIGDLDSVKRGTLSHFKGVRQIEDRDPERTDTEKAIDFVLGQGTFEQITLLGASRGRLDHVLGHVALLRKYHDRARLVLVDQHGRAYLARGDQRLDCPVGTVVSFFAVGAPAEGVTTEGFKYPLRDRRLELGAQDSISNVVDAVPAWIRMRSGELLIVEVTRP